MIINFVEHCSIQVNGTRTVYLLRKPSMWDVGGSSTMFTCENWVHFWKEYCPPLSVFMCEEHELCTKLLLQVNGRRTVSLVKKKKHECKKHEGLRHCFPVRLHLASERNTAYLSGISNVRSITFVWNSSIQVNGSNTVSPVRKSSTLEAGGSSTLFSCEKWGGLLKEYLRFESILKWKTSFTLRKVPPSGEMEKHFYLMAKYNVFNRGKSVLHLVWELNYILKGILPTSQSFHVWGTSL
jgi:hypothetical protein